MRDDRVLFELLLLEGAQAGLSWYTILKKRDNYRRAMDNFEPELDLEPVQELEPAVAETAQAER